MTDDKDIEKLFSTAKTEFEDNAQFMDALSEKLDKVEFVKQIQERKLRSYKIGLIVAFAVGVVFGAIGLLVILHLPAESVTLAETGFLANLFGGIRNMSAILLSLVVTGGAVCISLNIQDILRMKAAV